MNGKGKGKGITTLRVVSISKEKVAERAREFGANQERAYLERADADANARGLVVSRVVAQETKTAQKAVLMAGALVLDYSRMKEIKRGLTAEYNAVKEDVETANAKLCAKEFADAERANADAKKARDAFEDAQIDNADARKNLQKKANAQTTRALGLLNGALDVCGFARPAIE